VRWEVEPPPDPGHQPFHSTLSNHMAAKTYTCILSHGLGNNYTIEVTATSQAHARKVAAAQTGDKCIGAQ